MIRQAISPRLATSIFRIFNWFVVSFPPFMLNVSTTVLTALATVSAPGVSE